MNLREKLAELGFIKKEPQAKLELQDVVGEPLVFSTIGDIAQVKEGVPVDATDGEHVLTIDEIVYTVNVADGKIASVVKKEEDQTAEFVETVVTAFNDLQSKFGLATAEITNLRQELTDLKANLSHKQEPTKPVNTGVNFGGKTFDVTKLNFKK
jgi:hypothetical protein